MPSSKFSVGKLASNSQELEDTAQPKNHFWWPERFSSHTGRRTWKSSRGQTLWPLRAGPERPMTLHQRRTMVHLNFHPGAAPGPFQKFTMDQNSQNLNNPLFRKRSRTCESEESQEPFCSSLSFSLIWGYRLFSKSLQIIKPYINYNILNII